LLEKIYKETKSGGATNSLNVKVKQLMLTARGKPRKTNTTTEAILIVTLAPIALLKF